MSKTWIRNLLLASLGSSGLLSFRWSLVILILITSNKNYNLDTLLEENRSNMSILTIDTNVAEDKISLTFVKKLVDIVAAVTVTLPFVVS